MSTHVFMAAARIPVQDIPVRGALEYRLENEPVAGKVDPDGFIALSTPRVALNTLTKIRRDAGPETRVIAVELVIPNAAYRPFLGVQELAEGLDSGSDEKWFVIGYPKRCLKSLMDFMGAALPETADGNPLLRHDLVYHLRDLPEFRQVAAIDYLAQDTQGRPMPVTQVLHPEAVRLRSARNLPPRVKIVSPFQDEETPQK